MNLRIQQLAEQAGLKWKAQPPHYTNTNNPIDFPVSANRDLEKFALLIVQECIDIISPYTIRMSRPGEEYLHPILEIRKNFGVK